MRFLHLADIHLDTLFAGRSPSLRQRLREASREALARAFRLARDRDVDAVLVAGDLFDGERLSFQTEGFLMEELGRLGEAGIPVLYATGNHDPGEVPAGRDRIRWPEPVVLFDAPEPSTVTVERAGRPVGRVTGVGHATPREGRDLSRTFPAPGADLPSVALLHTQVGGAAGAGEHDRYAPSELAYLRASAFDYWALGHIHLRQELSRSPAIHFPGNLVGRSPRETGAKGGLLVEIPGPGVPPTVEFVELATVRWERLRVDGIDGAATLDGLIGAIENAWDAARAGDPGLAGTEWFVRVELAGASPLHRELASQEELETLARMLRDALDALDVEVRADAVRPRVYPLEHLERQDAAGEALRLGVALGSPGGESPARALGISPADLAGGAGLGPNELDAYLRELLLDGDRMILERFLAGGEEDR